MDEEKPREPKKPQVKDVANGKKKVSVTKEEDKVPTQLVTDLVIRAVNHEKLESFPNFPAFPHVWCVAELSKGVRQAYEVSKNGLTPISQAYVCQEILSYAHKNFTEVKEFRFQKRQAEEISYQWLVKTKLSVPKLFSFSDEYDVVSYVKLPWKKELVPEETPLFDEMFSRMSNSKALKEFIGSIFFEESYNQQYAWLHGEGGDGKGALLRAIEAVMGELYAAKFPKEEGDKFWEYTLIGKRLVGFPEIEDGSFVTTGIFKMLTGGDKIFINPKGKDPFSYTPFAKYIFLSNRKPNVALDRSDKRRLIYVTVKGIGRELDSVEAAEYEAKLQLESPSFLQKCIKEFESSRTHVREPIKCDFTEYELLAEQNSEEFLVLADSFLDFAPHYTMPPHALISLLHEVKIRDYRKVGAFRNFLEKRFGVTKRAVRDHGHVKYEYLGVRRRTFSDPKIIKYGKSLVENVDER